METFQNSAQKDHAEGSRKAELFDEQLQDDTRAGIARRQKGKEAMHEAQQGLKIRLGEYGQKTKGEMERQVQVVYAFCERLGETSADGECIPSPAWNP